MKNNIKDKKYSTNFKESIILKKTSKRALCVFDVFRQISVWNKFKENTKKT